MITSVYLLSLVALSHTSDVEVLRCLECHAVTSPDVCQTWEHCGIGEMCYTKQFLTSNNMTLYRLGCEDKQVCDIYSHMMLVGKRSAKTSFRSRRMCRKCCAQTNCNSALCVDHDNHVTTTPGGPIPGNCLLPYCYLLNTDRHTWEDARNSCLVSGGQLVSITDSSIQHFVAKLLSKRNDKVFPSFYWTGGFFNQTLAEFQWMDGSVANLTYWDLFQPVKHTDSQHYKIGLLNPLHHVTSKSWAWSYIDHLDKGGSVCQVPYSTWWDYTTVASR